MKPAEIESFLKKSDSLAFFKQLQKLAKFQRRYIILGALSETPKRYENNRFQRKNRHKKTFNFYQNFYFKLGFKYCKKFIQPTLF